MELETSGIFPWHSADYFCYHKSMENPRTEDWLASALFFFFLNTEKILQPSAFTDASGINPFFPCHHPGLETILPREEPHSPQARAAQPVCPTYL